MAALIIIAGGIVGFASAVFSLAFLGMGLLSALGIWSAVGTLTFGLGLVVALIPARGDLAAIGPQAA